MLTPSEIVLLNGERFAPRAGLTHKFHLLHMEQDVSLTHLAQSMAVAAILANEQVGTLRLDPCERKTLFGLAKTTVLLVHPLRPLAWPEPSLEGDLARLAAQVSAEKDGGEVWRLLDAWLAQDCPDPYARLVERVEANLAQRGLLHAETRTKMKIFSTTAYSLPESTRLMGLRSLSSAEALLHSAQQQPERWRPLNEQVVKGIAGRTEHSDIGADLD